MNRNARNAYNALKRLGAPVYDSQDYNAEFILGAELRNSSDTYFADYYKYDLKEYLRDVRPGEDTAGKLLINGQVCENPFGIRTDVYAILSRYNLYGEWLNGGMVGIYQR